MSEPRELVTGILITADDGRSYRIDEKGVRRDTKDEELGRMLEATSAKRDREQRAAAAAATAARVRAAEKLLGFPNTQNELTEEES